MAFEADPSPSLQDAGPHEDGLDVLDVVVNLLKGREVFGAAKLPAKEVQAKRCLPCLVSRVLSGVLKLKLEESFQNLSLRVKRS